MKQSSILRTAMVFIATLTAFLLPGTRAAATTAEAESKVPGEVDTRNCEIIPGDTWIHDNRDSSAIGHDRKQYFGGQEVHFPFNIIYEAYTPVGDQRTVSVSLYIGRHINDTDVASTKILTQQVTLVSGEKLVHLIGTVPAGATPGFYDVKAVVEDGSEILDTTKDGQNNIDATEPTEPKHAAWIGDALTFDANGVCKWDPWTKPLVNSFMVCEDNPVILVPALGENSAGFGQLPSLLTTRELRAVQALDFATEEGASLTIPALAERFLKGDASTRYSIVWLENYYNFIPAEDRKFDLVGHSMGGLVCHSYMNSPGGAEKIRRAVTLATPFWGVFDHTKLGTSEQNRNEMHLGNDFLWNLNPDGGAVSPGHIAFGVDGDEALDVISACAPNLAGSSYVVNLSGTSNKHASIVFVDSPTHRGYRCIASALATGSAPGAVAAPFAAWPGSKPAYVFLRIQNGLSNNVNCKFGFSRLPVQTAAVDYPSSLWAPVRVTDDPESQYLSVVPNHAAYARLIDVPLNLGTARPTKLKYDLLNVLARQIAGTHSIEITYNLPTGSPTYSVDITCSSNEGLTYPAVISTAPSVPAGTCMNLLLNADDVLNMGFSKKFRFKVVATPSNSGSPLACPSNICQIDTQNPDLAALVDKLGSAERADNFDLMRERSKLGVFFSSGPYEYKPSSEQDGPWRFLAIKPVQGLGWTESDLSNASYSRLFVASGDFSEAASGTDVGRANANSFSVPCQNLTWSFPAMIFGVGSWLALDFPHEQGDKYTSMVVNAAPGSALFKRYRMYDPLPTPICHPGKRDYETANTLAKKLIIVLHGWNPDGDANPYEIGQFKGLVKNIEDQLLINKTIAADWDLYAYNWAEDATTGTNISISAHSMGGIGTGQENGTQAAEAGYLHGLVLGKKLRELTSSPEGRGLEKVHFIAHSSGTWVARSASLYLEATSGTQRLAQEITLLDPYNPTVGYDDYFGDKERSPLNTQDIEDWPDGVQGSSAEGTRFENIYSIDTFVTGTNETYWGEQPTKNGKIVVNKFLGSSITGYTYPYVVDAFGGHGGPINYYAYSVDLMAIQNSSDLDMLEMWKDSGGIGWWQSMFIRELNDAVNATPDGAVVNGEIKGETFCAIATFPASKRIPQSGGNAPQGAPPPSGWQSVVAAVDEVKRIRLILVPVGGGAAIVAGPVRLRQDGTFATTLADGTTIVGAFNLSATPPTLTVSVNGNDTGLTANRTQGSCGNAGPTASLTANGTLLLALVASDGTAAVSVDGDDINGAAWKASAVGTVDALGNFSASSTDGFSASGLVSGSDGFTTEPTIVPPAGVIPGGGPQSDSDLDGMPLAFEQWIINASTTDALNLPTDVLPLDDYDNDGMVNLLEYAFGGDPVTPDAADRLPRTAWVEVAGEQYFALSFRRIKFNTLVAYVVEESTDMAIWQALPLNTSMVGTPVDQGDGTEVVTVRASAPLASGNSCFMHVKVSPLVP